MNKIEYVHHSGCYLSQPVQKASPKTCFFRQTQAVRRSVRDRSLQNRRVALASEDVFCSLRHRNENAAGPFGFVQNGSVGESVWALGARQELFVDLGRLARMQHLSQDWSDRIPYPRPHLSSRPPQGRRVPFPPQEGNICIVVEQGEAGAPCETQRSRRLKRDAKSGFQALRPFGERPKLSSFPWKGAEDRPDSSIS